MQIHSQEFVDTTPINTQTHSQVISPKQLNVKPSFIPSIKHENPIISQFLTTPENTTITGEDIHSEQSLLREYSITFQINLLGNGHGQWRVLFHHGNANTVRQPACWLCPGSNLLHCRCDSSVADNAGFDSRQEIDLNRWTHVGLVYYGPYQFLFIDGKLDKYEKFGQYLKRNDNQNFHLFESGYGYDRANAQIKNFRMYNMALCDVDILEDMKSDFPISMSTRLEKALESKSDSFLRRDLVQLLEMKEFANVHIACSDSDQILYANHAILVARSLYFKTLLSTQWNNSKEYTSQNPFVMKVEFEYLIMKYILEYIYTGTIKTKDGECIPMETLLKLTQVGNQLMLTEMEDLATRFIIPNITTDNVCELFDLAETANIESLFSYCKIFISNRFKLIPTERITSLRTELLSIVISDLKNRLQ
ncbi:predicted protein [Naegleria gruberi]|uniref:Predicted protein n=1 Tax=Naegleria gruberi TaxID=5762 RepID=D2VQW3_NAEGR|nr:uncharacterized protein NAEGRDRAFT_71368 [Naegleria gruberi]EFC40783.1 predicted protein [Naegleria gruberi]|eukprot:XP_002673527.1 predicted protein [Naegleria gruberi strain NEG-M]